MAAAHVRAVELGARPLDPRGGPDRRTRAGASGSTRIRPATRSVSVADPPARGRRRAEPLRRQRVRTTVVQPGRHQLADPRERRQDQRALVGSRDVVGQAGRRDGHRRPPPSASTSIMSCRTPCSSPVLLPCQTPSGSSAGRPSRNCCAARTSRASVVWAGGSSSPRRSSTRTRARSAAQVVLSRPLAHRLQVHQPPANRRPAHAQLRAQPVHDGQADEVQQGVRGVVVAQGDHQVEQLPDRQLGHRRQRRQRAAAADPLAPPAGRGSASPTSPRATRRSTATRTGTLTVLAAGTTRLPPTSTSTPVRSATTTETLPGCRGDQVGQRLGEVGQGPAGTRGCEVVHGSEVCPSAAPEPACEDARHADRHHRHRARHHVVGRADVPPRDRRAGGDREPRRGGLAARSRRGRGRPDRPARPGREPAGAR